jgi:chemotaxis protein MotB
MRMSVAGQGEYQPVADNASPAGRNHNRRVTLVILDTVGPDTAAGAALAEPAAAAVAPADATLAAAPAAISQEVAP